MAAMEILAWRGARAFRVRDQPGLHLEIPTKHGEQSPVSWLAGRTAGVRDHTAQTRITESHRTRAWQGLEGTSVGHPA